ncbi:MAG TPA: hypothetical protein VII13_10475 [Vicinamibacteria bacterium]
MLAVLLAALMADAPAPGPLSWADAQSLGSKLAAIERHRRLPAPRPRQTVTVTEGELNSYLNLSLGPRMPQGLTAVQVRMLANERLEASGTVDLEKVRGHVSDGGSMLNPLALLSGEVPVYLSGRFRNKDGFGTIEWEEARLSALPIPITMLEKLVAGSTKSKRYPEGWDIHAPFRLPYAVQRIRLELGRAFLEF